MFALIVRFDVVPDKLDEFDALVEATLADIREKEEDTLVYLSATVEGEPTTRVFVEVYRDEAAFAAHETQPHTQAFLSAREPMLRSFTVSTLTPRDAVLHAERPGRRSP